MAAKRFTVQLERVGKTATSFTIPFGLREAFVRARPPAEVTSARRIAGTVDRLRDGVPAALR